MTIGTTLSFIAVKQVDQGAHQAWRGRLVPLLFISVVETSPELRLELPEVGGNKRAFSIGIP
jgi:hypothetical protein